MEDIFTRYRNGSLSNLEFIKEFSQFMAPLFKISRMMSGLDMAWVIDGSGIVANFKLDIASEREMLEIKLHLDDMDMAQIPYDYLIENCLPESEEFKIFFNLLGNNGTFIDIGANVGWYSLLAAYYGAQVYSFEPIQKNYQRLCENIKLNELTSIKTFNMGLGEKNGIDTFYFHEGFSGSSSRANLDYLADGLSQAIDCTIDTLDNVCAKEKIQQINLIKCDVEGGEIFVFQGAIEAIRRFRPFVLSEMLRKWSAKFHYHPNDIIKFFEKLDYKCIALSKERPGVGYIMKQMLETTEETNFLFIPNEKESFIQSFMTIDYLGKQ